LYTDKYSGSRGEVLSQFLELQSEIMLSLADTKLEGSRWLYDANWRICQILLAKIQHLSDKFATSLVPSALYKICVFARRLDLYAENLTKRTVCKNFSRYCRKDVTQINDGINVLC
jgi:hypothetical protein